MIIKMKIKNKTLARVVPLLCKVLRSLPYDMIIGRPDIDRYDLWYLLRNARIEASPECKYKINRHIAMPGQSTTTPANIHGETLVNSARNKTAEAVMRAQENNNTIHINKTKT